MRALYAVTFLLLLTATPAMVLADDRCADATPVLHVRNGHRYYELPLCNLHGERQAPYVFTLGGRSAVDASRPEVPPSNTSQVIDAVRRAPF